MKIFFFFPFFPSFRFIFVSGRIQTGAHISPGYPAAHRFKEKSPVPAACLTCGMPYLHKFFPHHPLPASPWKNINTSLMFMRFHGIAVLYYFAVNGTPLRDENQLSLSAIPIPINLIKMPVPIQDFHLPNPLLAGSMQGGLAKSLHSPKQGTLPSPCPSSGVLFRLPSPGRSIIMAPLRASCHEKPRTGCRSLPSFSFYSPSVYPLQGRHIMAKLLVRRKLIQGKTS